ncbi:hypothetical protein EJB05_48554, partial [Eragrostis curvula]
MADDGFSIPTDAFVDILLRLPQSARRRFRLVCRHWRDVINERTPEPQVRAKILAFLSRSCHSSRAYVFDNNGGRRTREWRFPTSHSIDSVDMVGTCNGLICLHEFLFPIRGTIMVTNPITGDKFVLPPLPTASSEPKQFLPPLVPAATSHADDTTGMYSFGYHPRTGRYKVVHITYRSGTKKNSVLVFTLGHESWREVPDLNQSGVAHKNSSILSVDGSTYWFTTPRCDRVTALDLDDDERVASFDAPPVMQLVKLSAGFECRLTTVHARLGAVVTRRVPATTRVDVWVLESRRDERALWSRRYSLVEPDEYLGRWITAPHFTHGEYVMSESRTSWYGTMLCRRKVGDLTDDGNSSRNKQLRPLVGAQLIMKEREYWETVKTFAYVETLEPLPASMLGGGDHGGI